MKNILFLSIIILFAGLGCEFEGFADPYDVNATRVKTYAADEIKLISPLITSASDPTTSLQQEYTVSPDSRLLLRVGTLKTLAKEIVSEQAVILRVTPHLRTDFAAARRSLRLCPLTSNWMMYATWASAHPYTNGQWKNPGGDFDSAGCLQALDETSSHLKNSEEASFCQIQTYLCFDIQDHFKSYVKARNINYGWVLVSAEDVEIYGNDTARSPEIFFRRFR